ncbi:MAG: helix-turn-helix transcriptional regulator [Proteobacteria bacterium]|nr:helix-turn-helix transcriptional regulator [Pseudomonadota bacterium]
MKFGELIRSRRKQSKLSIRQIADAVGTNPSYLHELEHGKTVNIRLPLAAKLGQTLKIPLAKLAATALREEQRNAAKPAKRSAGGTRAKSRTRPRR